MITLKLWTTLKFINKNIVKSKIFQEIELIAFKISKKNRWLPDFSADKN